MCSMKEVLRALIIENSSEFSVFVKKILCNGGFDPHISTIRCMDQIKDALKDEIWDIILSEYNMPGFSVLDVLSLLKENDYKLPLILISDESTEELLVRAIKAGACDFINKKNPARLVPAICRELEEIRKKNHIRSSEFTQIKKEQKCRQILESIMDVFFTLDENLHCIFWNKAAQKLTKISVKSALAKPFIELFPENPGKDIETILLESMRCLEQKTFTFSMEHNSSLKIFELNTYPVDNGISVLMRDITKRNFTEEFKKSQEKMRIELSQANELRILGNLTSGVAHEVRNPLNAISVVIEALFQELGDKTEFLPYKEHIFNHVERLKRLMQDLLELGKPIERSKVTTLNLIDVIKESVKLWQCSGTNTPEIILETASDVNLKIKADPHKIQQVFVNVLENASQHSPGDSRIIIEIFSVDDSGCINFKDNGSGVEPHYLERVFDPFFTTRKRGTGLGLSIVKHIIESHGGTIKLYNNDSAPGCTVQIKLPFDDSSKENSNIQTLSGLWATGVGPSPGA